MNRPVMRDTTPAAIVSFLATVHLYNFTLVASQLQQHFFIFVLDTSSFSSFSFASFLLYLSRTLFIKPKGSWYFMARFKGVIPSLSGVIKLGRVSSISDTRS